MIDAGSRIIIADDHALIRKGLRQVIEADANFELVGEAATGKEALELILHQAPHVAVLDVNMPEMSGFDVAHEIQKRGLDSAIIFLTMHKDKDFFNKAMDAGAKGYVLKDGALDEIVDALNAVVRGNPYISPLLSSYLIQRMDRVGSIRPSPGLEMLTPTEKRVLKLIAEYKTSKEIAEALHIHYRTVDNHRTNICTKLGLQGSHSLLKFAVEHQEQIR